MAKAVKLADIAQKLGVSTVTVSKALSGQKGVSEEMRGKIRQLADEMGYVKTTVIEKDAGRRSYTLGVIAADRYVDENDSFYWQLYQQTSQRASQKNCFTMLEIISFEAEQGGQLPKMIEENKVDAVIIMGSFRIEYVRFLKQNIRIPLIFLDTIGCDGDCDAVVSNNMMGAYQMTNYLFQLGHEKIGFVGTRLATSSIDDRYLGYLKAAMEHGMKVREDWVVDDRDRETGSYDYARYPALPQGDMPTAFFCNNDVTAYMLIQKLQEHGYRVPEDISVVGFDNFQSGFLNQIGMTTYAINTREMTQRVVHIAIHKIENPDYSTGVYMIAGRFIERESARQVGPPVPFV